MPVNVQRRAGLRSLLRIAGWIALVLTTLSAVGILGGGSPDEVAALSLLLPIPDFQTIILGIVTAAIGLFTLNLGRSIDGKKSGLGVMIGAIACVIFTFTPAATYVQIMGSVVVLGAEQSKLVQVEIPGKELEVRAFIGDRKSKPSDHDILEWSIDGYDGAPDGEYSEYRVCGYILPYDVYDTTDGYSVHVILTDADGNDITVGGKPAELVGKMSEKQRNQFSSDTIKAGKLSAAPAGFRVDKIVFNMEQQFVESFQKKHWREFTGDLNPEDYLIRAYIAPGNSSVKDHSPAEVLFTDFASTPPALTTDYRVCGYFLPSPDAEGPVQIPENWYLDLVLTDADGNDILLGSSPAAITIMSEEKGQTAFESVNYTLEELSVPPAGVRVSGMGTVSLSQFDSYGFEIPDDGAQSAPEDYAFPESWWRAPSGYDVFAFLGSGDSHWGDHDIAEFLDSGYDGHADGTYDSYRICGTLEVGLSGEEVLCDYPETYQADFLLTDASGNVILEGGQPAVISIRMEEPGLTTFESEVFSADGLSAEPCGIRLLRVGPL